MLNNTGLNGVYNSNQTLLKKQKTTAYQPSYLAGQLQADTISFTKPANNVIAFGRKGKSLNVVTFTGLKNPLQDQPLALQMKVRGVTAHQHKSDSPFPPQDYNVNTLAGEKVVAGTNLNKSKNGKRGKSLTNFVPGKVEIDPTLPRWKDGQKLNYSLYNHPKLGEQITLNAPGIGPIGRVHDEITELILPLLFESGAKREDFRFELSNMVAGTTKGAETIGLRVNLKYLGKDPQIKEATAKVFDQILNDPQIADKVLLYQEKTSPEQVLKTILDYEAKANGPEAAKEMQEVIDNIVKEIKSPENKRILIVGHCKPDGDTLGCVLGMKNAISLMDENKVVDCAVDDKIPGLFRHKMPGITGIMKRPVNPERVDQMKKQVANLQTKEQTSKVKEQIQMLTEEIALMQDDSKLLDPNAKYDLVITMDIPTPKRFTDKFKNYFDSANKVIYIDHHPHRLDEWKEASKETGLDIEKIHENKLAWIADGVPAATQLVGILGNKLIPGFVDIASGKTPLQNVFNKPEQLDGVKAYVASLVTGASTDTGSFTRTANLLPEHIKNQETGETVPVQQRPNFLPEGMSKWLMDLTDGAIDKKWLREEISWDLSEKKIVELDASARDIMLKHAIAGRTVNPDLSLGFIEVDYDQMNQVWQAQREIEPDTTLLDIQNSFKYSETLGVLRADPTVTGGNRQQGGGGRGGDFTPKSTSPAQELKRMATEDYSGKFDKDRIAILICQDKKAGELDEKLTFANQNGLRLSLRSPEGSMHAELIATLFGGGGHGGAAGGRIDLPGVELDTPLAVKINGKTENDYGKVLEALKSNYEILHKHKATAQDKARLVSIKVEKEDSGVRATEIITNLVTEIRSKQEAEEAKSETKTKTVERQEEHPNSSKSKKLSKREKRRIRKQKENNRNQNLSFTGFLQNIFNQKVS